MTTDVLLEDAKAALQNDMAATVTRLVSSLKDAGNWEGWNWAKIPDADKYAILRLSEQLVNLFDRVKPPAEELP